MLVDVKFSNSVIQEAFILQLKLSAICFKYFLVTDRLPIDSTGNFQCKNLLRSEVLYGYEKSGFDCWFKFMMIYLQNIKLKFLKEACIFYCLLLLIVKKASYLIATILYLAFPASSKYYQFLYLLPFYF